MKKITPKTTLAEIIRNRGSKEVLAKHSVPCLSCPMAKFEMERLKIGEVCKMYGLPLENILKELNNKEMYKN